jgi:hypothetical protein
MNSRLTGTGPSSTPSSSTFKRRRDTGDLFNSLENSGQEEETERSQVPKTNKACCELFQYTHLYTE